ncbi:AAA family ATPase [Streptomyces sp. AM6-12]|uniref:AAA family ATPase n=1 Tax=Streptomyces sp. AM6-12 TaxID=3345149 RepID=UPI0037B70447
MPRSFLMVRRPVQPSRTAWPSPLERGWRAGGRGGVRGRPRTDPGLAGAALRRRSTAVPVGAVRLVRFGGSTNRDGTIMTLVGRTTAIRTLTDAFTNCAEGCSRTVLVEGPTGCGKSALVHLLIERAAAAGAVVLCATGSPAGRRTAWNVVRQLLTGLSGPLRRTGIPQREPRAEDLRSLYAELREAAGDGPLVLCVDDVHHADDESLAFLSYLARHARAARTLLVLAGPVHHESGDPAFTTGLMHLPTSRRIRLERLGPAEVTALAERAGCREQVCSLYELSGGNPLLLRTLLDERSGAAPGARRPAPGCGGCPPAGAGIRHGGTAADPGGPFARAVHACLHRAGATAAAVGRAAAVLDRATTPERITELTGIAPPAVRRGLAGLRAAGLLSGAGHPTPAVRAAVLGALSPADLVALHRRAALVLHRQGRPAVEAAGHLLSAALSATGWSATGEETELLCAAAESRMAEGDGRCALALLEAAHQLCGEGARRDHVAVRLARAGRLFGPTAAVRLPAGPPGGSYEGGPGGAPARPLAQLLPL